MTGANTQFTLNKISPAYWRATFNNPPINMLDAQTVIELQGLLKQFETDPELRVVVFDSADPDFFIAHFDAASAGDIPREPGPSGHSGWLDITERLARAPVVTIAAVRGRARGVGSEFALACDLRFASLETAIFGQIEVGVGVIPGGGAIERLPLLTGRARALEIIAGAEDFDAATAERYGWINRAIADVDFTSWVDRFARRLASFDKQALVAAKELVNRRTLPDPEDQLQSQRVFYSAFGWNGYRERGPRARAMGLNQRGDFELNLGDRLGDL